MKKMKALFALTRPLNVLIASLSIFMGAFIAGSIQPLRNVIIAVISGAIIGGAANAINDYYDVNIDKINKPFRPIPAGLVTRHEAFIFSIVLFLIGLILGILINLKALVIAIFACIILYLYSAKLKRTVLWGNLAVSLITAFAFIYGGVAVNLLNAALIPAGFAFLFHLGREILKDIEDQEGDMADNATTLPLKYGTGISLITITIIYVFLIFTTLLPYIFNIFGLYYFLVVIIGVDFVLIYSLISIWKDSTPSNLGRLSTILKIDMLVGLIAIYVGRL